MLKTISIGIPSKSILFRNCNQPVVALKFINDRGEAYFFCENARSGDGKETSWAICPEGMPPADSEGRRALRSMRQAEVDFEDPHLGHDTFIKTFSVAELLDILNGLRCLYNEINDTGKHSRLFSKASRTYKSEWELALKACMTAVKTALIRIFYTDLSYRQVDDGDEMVIDISGLESCVPAGELWITAAKFPVGSKQCYGISSLGVVKCVEGQPVMAMPFGRRQRFFVTMANHHPGHGERKSPSGESMNGFSAFFNPEVAGIYSLVPDAPYEISGTESHDGREYIAVVNNRGEEVWLSKEKAIILKEKVHPGQETPAVPAIQ